MDVKTTYTHGYLEEEIYTEEHEGFKVNCKEIWCANSKKVYGLKQAPKQWYKKFNSVMGEQFY